MKMVRNLALSLIAIAAMLAAQGCDWAPWYLLTPPPPISAPSDPAPTPFPTPGPSPTPFPTIDITRQEYDAALAKWQGAAVVEYEMVVGYNRVYSELSGIWRLRVKNGEVVEYNCLNDGLPATPEPRIYPHMLKFLTVEAMFEDIKRVLDDPGSARITIESEPFEVQYIVTFDDTLGYPRTLGIYPIYVTDNESYTEIRTLTILNSTLP